MHLIDYLPLAVVPVLFLVLVHMISRRRILQKKQAQFDHIKDDARIVRSQFEACAIRLREAAFSCKGNIEGEPEAVLDLSAVIYPPDPLPPGLGVYNPTPEHLTYSLRSAALDLRDAYVCLQIGETSRVRVKLAVGGE